MFYLSLRSFFICKGNVFYSLYSIISTFPFIPPLSKYLFPPSSTNLSQYSLPPHYMHFHQQFIITSTHNYFQKDLYFDLRTNFHPSITKPCSNNFQLFYLIKAIPTANIPSFLPCTQFHQLQRTTTTTTKTTCQQR